MCGRFSLGMTMSQVIEAFPFMVKTPATSTDWQPRYNVTPGTDVLVVVEQPILTRWGGLVRWGWPVPWRSGHTMINARVETMGEKAVFRDSRRAIVVADSYYEWQSDTKQPYRICDKTGALMKMAALILRSSTPPDFRVVILTEPATGALAAIHHRTPCLLDKSTIEDWYRGVEWSTHMAPSIATHVIPISTLVNNARVDSPELHIPRSC